MATILTHVRSPHFEFEVRRALDGSNPAGLPWRVRVHQSWESLLLALDEERPAAVVFDLGAAGRSRLDDVVRALSRHPCTAFVLYDTDPARLRAQDVMELARAGVHAAVTAGIDDDPRHLRDVVGRAMLQGVDAVLLRELQDALGPDAIHLLALVFRHAREVERAGDLADRLGMSSRTLERRFDALRLGTPDRVVCWAQLHHAAQVLRATGGGPSKVLRGTRFSSPSAFRRALKRVVRLRIQDVRSASGAEALARRFARALPTAAEAAGSLGPVRPSPSETPAPPPETASERHFAELPGPGSRGALERIAIGILTLLLALPAPGVAVQDSVRVPVVVPSQLLLERSLELHLRPPPAGEPGEQGGGEPAPASDVSTPTLVQTLEAGTFRPQDFLRMELRPTPPGQTALPPRYVLPDTFRVRAPDGGPDLAFVPVAELRGAGLVLAPEPGLPFTGTVLVGLEAVGAPGLRARMGDRVRVDFVGGVDRTDPESFELDSIGPLRPVQVAVRSSREAGMDSVHLRLRLAVAGGTDHSSVEIALPLDRPRLVLLAHRSVLGFGLGRAVVSVRLPRDAPPGAWPVQLTLEGGRGSITPSVLVLEEGQVDSVFVRSAGLAGARILARSDPLAPGIAEVDYDVPLALLLVALFGGLLGGFLSGAWQRHPDDPRPGTARAAVGAAAGLVVVVAYTAGLNLLNLNLGDGTTEAVAFTLAVAGGTLGPGVVRLFGGNTGSTVLSSGSVRP
jgi:AraC-like DNA-binding protein